MRSRKELFLSHVGQTSEMPLLLEVDRAEGVYVYDKNGKKFIDMNSGIAVSSLGHCNPRVIQAINDQSKMFMHTMVYGEHVQGPQVDFAQTLFAYLPKELQCIYYLMSGTEAAELAIKLVRKYTHQSEVIACRNAYHGSTLGAESLRSDLSYKASFMPLIPGIKHISFNDHHDLDKISKSTGGVICEVIQGEAGVIPAKQDYLIALRKRCDETGTILVFDEIQSGFGRTGYLFAFQKYNVVPDVLLVGKAMGGGMPIAGVISSPEIMHCLVRNPALGHITTFGGHPVSCASANAALQELLGQKLIESVQAKEELIHSFLAQHPVIKEIRSAGLMMAVEPTKRKYLKHIVSHAFDLGVLVDWFLFNNRSFRLAPPLIMTEKQIKEACDILLRAFDYAQSQYD